jgi:hypothetical protein
MNKRNRMLAVLGAAALTLSVAGVALAQELKEAHQGIAVSWDEEGNPVNDGDIEMLDECDGVTPGEGQVIFHFVQSGQDTSPDEVAANNLLDVDFTGADDVTDVGADSVNGDKNVDWYVLVDATSDTVIVDDAESNIEGGELRISHICAGDEPDFGQSFGGETDEATEPSTDTFGTNGTSGPADGAWLLVVALGVLLASIVVLTPARAKSRR